MVFGLPFPLYTLHFYLRGVILSELEGVCMNKILGIVLIFAAAWLMFKLQAGGGSDNEEGLERSIRELQNRQGSCGGSCPEEDCKEEDEVYTRANPETDRIKGRSD